MFKKKVKNFIKSLVTGNLKKCFVIGVLLLTPNISTYANKKINIVATTPELGSLALAITGDLANVRTITSGREDPHFLQARPNFVVMARDADLWIRMGLDLEVGWEPVLIDSSRNPKIRPGQIGHFDAGAMIEYALEIPDSTATRAMGDVHPHGNPHYLTDPVNARSIAMALLDRIKKIDSANSSLYEKNFNVFIKKLDNAMFGESLVNKVGSSKLWKAERENRLFDLLEKEKVADLLGGWRKTMSRLKDKPIIVFHKSWSYFAHRFGVKIVAELEPLPGVPPSPNHLSNVVKIAKDQNVELIIREPFYPARPANFVAKTVGGMRVLEINSYGTESSPEGYLNFINTIIKAFTE